MLSKGQGTTMGTYGQLIRALDMDHRAEEAHKIWVQKIGMDLHSVPWQLCRLMISVYYRNNMLEDLVKVCFSLSAISVICFLRSEKRQELIVLFTRAFHIWDQFVCLPNHIKLWVVVLIHILNGKWKRKHSGFCWLYHAFRDISDDSKYIYYLVDFSNVNFGSLFMAELNIFSLWKLKLKKCEGTSILAAHL